MPVFERQQTKYYTISKEDHPKGLIRHKQGEAVHHYGGVEGQLVAIELKEDTYEGEKQYKWHFKFEDKDHSTTEILQIGETASAARGLLMTLASCDETIRWVSVAPYRSTEDGKTYTNLWVKVNGDTVEWKDEVVDNLPDVEEVKVGDKTVLNDTERRKYVRALAARVKKKKLAGGLPPDGSPNEGPSKGEVGQRAYERPEPPAPETEQPSQDDIDMSGWEDQDDDLPF